MTTLLTTILALASTVAAAAGAEPCRSVAGTLEAQSSCERGCERNYSKCARGHGKGMDVCAAQRRACYSKCPRTT